MTSLKDLKKRAGLLAKQLQIDEVFFDAAIELMEKGKIAKPAKVFKDTVAKINRRTRYPFLFLDLGQKKYFLMGDVFPMGAELEKNLEKTRKELEKAKRPVEKEMLGQLLFFYEQLEQLTPRGFATGTVKFSREVNNAETGFTECLMAIRKSGLKVDGTVKKGELVDLVREELDYELISKLGEVMFLEPAQEAQNIQTQEEDNDTVQNEEQVLTEAATTAEKGDPKAVTQQVKQLLGAFKQVPPQQAFKGLGLIYKMDNLIGTLEAPPENLQALSKKLHAQKKRFVPILAKQINGQLNHSMSQLDQLLKIEASAQLNELFGTVQKMYKGWKVFLDNEVVHPKSDILEQVDEEIDILAQYEAKIVPLRVQFEGLPDSTEKIELGRQINALIQEARKAIA